MLCTRNKLVWLNDLHLANDGEKAEIYSEVKFRHMQEHLPKMPCTETSEDGWLNGVCDGIKGTSGAVFVCVF